MNFFTLSVFFFLFVMVSKQAIIVNGLNLTVYGLEDYQLLGKDVPVAVMFALHGRLRKLCLTKHWS